MQAETICLVTERDSVEPALRPILYSLYSLQSLDRPAEVAFVQGVWVRQEASGVVQQEAQEAQTLATRNTVCITFETNKYAYLRVCN